MRIELLDRIAGARAARGIAMLIDVCRADVDRCGFVLRLKRAAGGDGRARAHRSTPDFHGPSWPP